MIIILHGGIGKTTLINKIKGQYPNIFMNTTGDTLKTYLETHYMPNNILMETNDLNEIPKEFFTENTFFVNVSFKHQVEQIENKIKVSIDTLVPNVYKSKLFTHV